jgi:hypothetical protein
MASGVEAEFKYGALLLTCDEEAFARLRDYITTEPSVAEASHRAIGSQSLRRISVTLPSTEPPPAAPHWAWGLLFGFASLCGSGIPLIVGYVTIYRWFMR